MRSILHVDMDAFYASVEERDRPEMKGKPLIVGGTGARGVVAAASYAVRRYGVRSAMPMREALRRCPEALCVQPRMARYQQVSAQVFGIFREFTPLVEPLSLDEAFLDVTASQRLLGSAETIGAEIRRRIRAATELTASVGIAPNKLLAKIASDLCKPDGLCRIDLKNVHEVLDGLPIQKLFGVGAKSLPTVLAAGIHTFGDLRGAGDEALWRAFGKHGKSMQALASGIDERPVVAEREEKSISAEETFSADIRDAAELRRQLTRLADRTAARLRAHGLAAAGSPSRSGARISRRTRGRGCWSRRRRTPPRSAPWRKSCCSTGWASTLMPRCDCWGSGRAICTHRYRPICSAGSRPRSRASTRPSTAFGTVLGPRW